MGNIDSKRKLMMFGGVLGVFGALLAWMGNPKNMAICIACFIRDTAGAMKLHQAAAVQYVRPEITGIVLGAFILSLVTREYRSTAGSSPMIRFLLGVIMMIGSLAFLGCPLRMVIRMAERICCAYRLWAWDCYRHPGLKAGIQSGARLWDKVVQRLYPALFPGGDPDCQPCHRSHGSQ